MIKVVAQVFAGSVFLFLAGGLIVSALGLKIGARLIGIRFGFFKALAAVLFSAALGFVVQAAVSATAGGLIGFLLGLLAVLGVIKKLGPTTWGQAFVLWILLIITQVFYVFIALGLTGYGLMEMLHRFRAPFFGPSTTAALPWLEMIT